MCEENEFQINLDFANEDTTHSVFICEGACLSVDGYTTIFPSYDGIHPSFL